MTRQNLSFPILFLIWCTTFQNPKSRQSAEIDFFRAVFFIPKTDLSSKPQPDKSVLDVAAWKLFTRTDYTEAEEGFMPRVTELNWSQHINLGGLAAHHAKNHPVRHLSPGQPPPGPARITKDKNQDPERFRILDISEILGF